MTALGGLEWLVTALVGGGRTLVSLVAGHARATQVLLSVSCIVGGTAWLWTRKPEQRQLLLLLLVPCTGLLAATCFLAQQPWLAFLAGTATAAALLAVPSATEETGGRHHRLLVLVPLAIAVLLRFFDLSGHTPGYPEHAAVHHAELSIPFYEQLVPSLLKRDWGALRDLGAAVIRDQHGPDSLVMALGFQLFGVSPTVTALVPATLGCLTVFCAYLAGSQLGGQRLGLAFSLLLAASPWHVSISRYPDVEHVLSPLQALLVLYLTWRALHQGGWIDYLLGALVLAAGWFIYAPNQALLAVVGVFACFKLISDRQLLRRDAPKLAAASLLFATASFLPVRDFVQRGRLLPVRSTYQEDARNRLFDPARLARMVAAESRQLFTEASDPWFGKPGGGLGVTEAALLVPGVALCLIGLRKPEERDAAVWLLVALPLTFLPGVLAPDESFRRLLLAATFALLLAGKVLQRYVAALAAAGASGALRSVLTALFWITYVAVSSRVYFDQVHVYESESHRYHREMAQFVRGVLATERVVIAVGHDWDVDDHRRYLKLFAYDRLRTRSTPPPPDAPVRIIMCDEMKATLANEAAIPGRVAVVAEQYLLREAPAGPELRATVEGALAGYRTTAHRDRTGDVLFTSWEGVAGGVGR